MPALTETFSGGADSLKGVGTAAAGFLLGVGATLKMHDTVEEDQLAIILTKGKVKLDRNLMEQKWGVTNMRRGRRILATYATVHGLRKLDVMAEHAAIIQPGSHFTFFNVRALRKIDTNDQTNRLPDQRVGLNQGLSVLEHSLTWGIEPTGKNAARALLRVRNMTEVTQKVIAAASGSAREAVLGLDADNPGGTLTSADIFRETKNLCAAPLERDYGVRLMGYDLLGLELAPDDKGRRIIFEGPDGLPILPDAIGSFATTAAMAHTTADERGALHAVNE